ncbi:MAG: valine--tRNA ligase [Gammaproteobacteria bacterium]
MEKTYDPHLLEQQLYDSWEQAGHFRPSGKGKPYCIMIPPPNITGSLHMGHGFQNTLMDVLIRYHRMCGFDTHWQAGTDHAGIATQMVVERGLTQQGLPSRQELGRESFIEKVWQWKNQSGGRIVQQLRRLGCSMDWEQERFTLDDGLSEAVQQVFIQLYEEGLIYRGKRLVNWDPKFHTAISDLEVISEEVEGHLWHIRYPLSEGADTITIATTRPETLLGDTAVAVHPEDSRYAHLVGKTVCLPLNNRKIPIIADEYVDPEFGSGCVKITPAHDFNDYAVGQRHELPLINILTFDAKMNNHEAVPEKYRGLDRFEARKAIVADLEALGLIVSIEKHHHNVPKGDRSGVIIEPMLTDQWFVHAKPLADKALATVKNGHIAFVPNNWEKIYFQWLENIEDWCISRQLWWGHRIPAWYDEAGNVYVGPSEEVIRTKHQLTSDVILTQDEDVLDTWFSSALWPFSTLGWPEKTPKFQRYYPTNVLITGFDIIFFWVARMVMFGEHFTQQRPFKEVYITGLIRDQDGQKMSKSKGNVLDPLDLIDGIDLESLVTKRTTGLMQPHLAQAIEKSTRKHFPTGIPAFGTDALRFTFCALATHGRDIRFDVDRLAGYRNFCNKLWNAARFVLMHTEDHVLNNDPRNLSIADKWIFNELQHTIQAAHQHMATYRFDLLTQCLYDFTWNTFCDWYVELAKISLAKETPPEQQQSTRYTLVTILEKLLRLLHPIMPFITETIWQQVAPVAGYPVTTLMLQSYPQYEEQHLHQEAAAQIQWLQRVITGLRALRNEQHIPPSKKLPLMLKGGTKQDQAWLSLLTLPLQRLAKIDSIEWIKAENPPEKAASTQIDTLELLLPIAEGIDKTAEKARLEREITQLMKELQQTESKLANKNFLSRAPQKIVEKQQQKQVELQRAVAHLQAQLTKT